MNKVSVLILTKNEAHNLDYSLGSVFQQQIPGDFLEVIAIDSGSTDGTVEKLRSYPVRFFSIDPKSFHHAKTRNLAASYATGDILIYLAADAFPASTRWLANLTRHFEDSSVGAVYGRHLPKRGSGRERQEALSTLYGPDLIRKRAGHKDGMGYRYYHFSTVNAAIRRTAWQQFAFPEDFKVFEDIGIASKLLRGSWDIVYDPEAAVLHSHDYPAGKLFRRYFDIGVVYHRLGLWDQTTRGSVASDGAKGAWRKITRGVREQQLGDVSTALILDAAKYLGILLGRNERLLPRPIKRRMSAFGLFD